MLTLNLSSFLKVKEKTCPFERETKQYQQRLSIFALIFR